MYKNKALDLRIKLNEGIGDLHFGASPADMQKYFEDPAAFPTGHAAYEEENHEIYAWGLRGVGGSDQVLTCVFNFTTQMLSGLILEGSGIKLNHALLSYRRIENVLQSLKAQNFEPGAVSEGHEGDVGDVELSFPKHQFAVSFDDGIFHHIRWWAGEQHVA